MKTANTLLAAGLAALFGVQCATLEQGPARTPSEQLGTVHFPTSCSPAVEKPSMLVVNVPVPWS